MIADSDSDVAVRAVEATQAEGMLGALADLLQDAVADGASVGFLPPLSHEEAADYWRGVFTAMHAGQRVLLAAWADGQLAGAVQLGLELRPNGSHRAEVMKLLVHTRHRRKGIGRALMLALEATARRDGRTTLVLDTRAGDPSEQLYAGLGYTRVGVIPQYARSADGHLHSTVFMYKLLG